ncbi:hypothetical protein J1N35_035320 [Gossypium stocksii]|uniref:Uncharacterized protein n=1 Tax=Gossypium stocksii TaxID=47602 RepID=A0A9D3UTR4_9ROSI|nr:hypothetical protein J1N35_035320 [Gossypium stocksii]
MAAGNTISEQEQVSITLASLSVEYESIRIVASAMSIPLDRLAEMLTDCEARQQEFVSSMSLQALSTATLMTKVLGDLTEVLGHPTEVVLGHFKDEVEGDNFLITNHSVSYVARLVTQFRSATIDLMRPLKNSTVSNHVTNDLDNLHEVAQCSGNNRLLMGNGVSVPVANIGSYSFVSSNRIFQLKNVLLVP